MRKDKVLLGRMGILEDKKYYHIVKPSFKKPWGALSKKNEYYTTYIRGGEMWFKPKKNTDLKFDKDWR